MAIPEKAQPLQVVTESPQTPGSHVPTNSCVYSLTYMYPHAHTALVAYLSSKPQCYTVKPRHLLWPMDM